MFELGDDGDGCGGVVFVARREERTVERVGGDGEVAIGRLEKREGMG